MPIEISIKGKARSLYPNPHTKEEVGLQHIELMLHKLRRFGAICALQKDLMILSPSSVNLLVPASLRELGRYRRYLSSEA